MKAAIIIPDTNPKTEQTYGAHGPYTSDSVELKTNLNDDGYETSAATQIAPNNNKVETISCIFNVL